MMQEDNDPKDTGEHKTQQHDFKEQNICVLELLGQSPDQIRCYSITCFRNVLKHL